jgi:hypothetical protein
MEKCPVCQKEFRAASGLQWHLEHSHGGEGATIPGEGKGVIVGEEADLGEKVDTEGVDIPEAVSRMGALAVQLGEPALVHLLLSSENTGKTVNISAVESGQLGVLPLLALKISALETMFASQEEDICSLRKQLQGRR